MRVLVLAALAACSYPEKVPVDGQGPPFGCLNAPAATKADNPVVLSGTTTDSFTLAPIGNASIAGELPGLGTPVFTIHSDASGKFSQSQATGGLPLDINLAVSAGGYVDTYYYPGRPVTHDITMPVQLLTPAAATTLAMAASVKMVDATNGAMLFTVDDCNGAPVAGATITTSPAGKVRYFNGVQPAPSATATDTAGVAMVAELPPGNVTLTATVNGMTYKTRNYQVVGGAFIQTIVEP